MFFDTLGIRWQYEPETFDLKHMPINEKGEEWYRDPPKLLARKGSVWYMPDFFLSSLSISNVWVEIKGAMPTMEEAYKCLLLNYWSGQSVLLCFGGIPFADRCEWIPDAEGMRWFEDMGPLGNNLYWGECSLCRKISFGSMDFTMCSKDCGGRLAFTSPRLCEAYQEARTAFRYKPVRVV